MDWTSPPSWQQRRTRRHLRDFTWEEAVRQIEVSPGAGNGHSCNARKAGTEELSTRVHQGRIPSYLRRPQRAVGVSVAPLSVSMGEGSFASSLRSPGD